MTTSALVNILTPTELDRFEENFYSLVEDYKQNGSISLWSVLPILGRPPVLPMSHDMDAMLDAVEARSAYGNKLKQIEQVFLT